MKNKFLNNLKKEKMLIKQQHKMKKRDKYKKNPCFMNF